MRSDDLTREQIEQLSQHVGRTFGYFSALSERAQKQQFPFDDEIRQAVNLVCDNLQALSVKLHYLSCKGSCGRHKQIAAGELRTAYRLQAVATPDVPLRPQFMYDIDAETPLEAVAKWARHGALNNKLNAFWVRVILSEDDVLALQLTTDFVRPPCQVVAGYGTGRGVAGA